MTKETISGTLSIEYSVQCAVCSLQCAVFSVQFAVCSGNVHVQAHMCLLADMIGLLCP